MSISGSPVTSLPKASRATVLADDGGELVDPASWTGNDGSHAEAMICAVQAVLDRLPAELGVRGMRFAAGGAKAGRR